MTPRQLGVEIVNAHDYRAGETVRERVEQLVRRCETAELTLAAVTGRNLASMDRHQLEARRNEIHVQLAAVNDQLHRINATRNGDLAAGRLAPTDGDAAPLEPSDPTAA